MVLISVDLPHPFGPSTATCSCARTRRQMSSRTIFPPRITRTFRKSSNGAWGLAGIEFMGLSQSCNIPAISRGYLNASCPSNREGYQDGLGGLRAVLFNSWTLFALLPFAQPL